MWFYISHNNVMLFLDQAKDGISVTANKKEKNFVYATIILYQWELYDSKVTDIKLELNKKDFHWQILKKPVLNKSI